jgi:hypothetical protein
MGRLGNAKPASVIGAVVDLVAAAWRLNGRRVPGKRSRRYVVNGGGNNAVDQTVESMSGFEAVRK